MRTVRVAVVAAVALLFAVNAFALSIVDQSHYLTRFQNMTFNPLKIVFNASLNEATVTTASVGVVYDANPTQNFAFTISFATTTVANDTVVLTPTDNGGHWPFAKRLRLSLAATIAGQDGSPFDGVYRFGNVFVANIPDNMDILADWNPSDPLDFEKAFVNANVLAGYNVVDPEHTDLSKPETIPGMGATEAWKLTGGRPEIIVAVVDTGFGSYTNPQLEENTFLNRGELPPPTNNGVACSPDPYDCNHDGKFNIRDYDNDPHFANLGRKPTIPDLFTAFADGKDNDNNGFVDDICGWDFLRNTNQALGVSSFPEGTHGEQRAGDVVDIADNGLGQKPGYCPFCTVLPVRVSDSVMTEANNLAAGLAYAYRMGAKVAVFASESLNQSDEVNKLLTQLSEGGMTLIGVASDEDSYQHVYPGSYDDVITIKAIFPIPAITFLDVVPMTDFAFTETYCTMWGEHVHLASSSGACSSEASSDTAGLAGLILSRALDLGLELSANEVKQILTMSADDIWHDCLTLTGGGCQVGWDAHFGYGRPNARNALAMLGDPANKIPAHIPPEAKIRSPAWFSVVDPVATPTLPVAGYLYARGGQFHWQLQLAVGKEPLDGEFKTVATGDGKSVIDGALASVDISNVLPADVYTQPPKTSFDFTVTLRLQSTTTIAGYGTVMGEDRRAIAIHRDRLPDTGLLPGFPIRLGSSGRASITLYDLDGDSDGRLEIVAATTGDGVTALKYNAASGQYQTMPGFPLSPADYNGLVENVTDSTLSHPAVGDLFGDGEPYIVVTTFAGAVLVFHRDGTLHLDGSGKPAPLLDGFPVYANTPDNSSPDAFGHGRAFLGSPVLADLDGSGVLDIIAASYDGNVYAWKPIPGADGKAQLMPGFPVFCSSEAGHVSPDKVCTRSDRSTVSQIVVTPAVGVLLPDSPNADLSKYPSILVGTSEVCEDYLGGNLKGTRFYAIYHDGNANKSGSPFAPGFPVKMFGPLADVLPLPPVGIGMTSAPAMAHYEGKTFIGVGPAVWLPTMIELDSNGGIQVLTLGQSPGFNALAQGGFGRLRDDKLYYILPISSILAIIDNWISLLKPMLMAWSLDDLNHAAIALQQHDCNWYTNPVVADITGDGQPDVILGNGGFTMEAVDLDGHIPADWPKFTNQWSASAPTIGDASGEGQLEVYQYTMEGWLYGWRTQGPTCNDKGQTSDWWTFQHDERNTGTFGVDTQPPSVVTDLKVTEAGEGSTLTFTAPGDDWHRGAPASYDIRYASSAAELSTTKAFQQAAKVTASAVPTPPVGGRRVSFTVPEVGWFAIQTVDHAGNHSLISAPVNASAPVDDDNVDDDNVDDDAAPGHGGARHSSRGCGC